MPGDGNNMFRGSSLGGMSMMSNGPASPVRFLNAQAQPAVGGEHGGVI